MDTSVQFAKRADELNIDNASNSASGLVSTLLPTLVISGAMVLVFMVLRLSQRRQYIPRTYIGSLREDERTPAPAPGLFGWIGSMMKLPDTYVLRHHSMDAYLLLRYLKISSAICFVGCLISWPILFPVNATGGGGKKQLDMLTFGNVAGNLNRYYAHAFVAWIFIAFVFFMVTRESIYFINLRQAYFFSPLYANRISSKTVLFTSVPDEYLDEARIRKMYGDDKVKNVWLVPDVDALKEKVEDRDKAAFKLEDAETKLIKLATTARVKATKGKTTDEENLQATAMEPVEGESGSAAAKWIKPSSRPTHRLKMIIGKKVDTINWARGEIQRLNPEIEELQAKLRAGDAKLLSSVFVEFYTQNDAQAAYQMLAHNQPLHMAPRYIGLNPADIIWSNLRIKWWELIMRNAATIAVVIVMVIFWAIPVAFVGSISQINYLTDKVPFLRFILKCPPVILGLITSLLPVILLSVLMALLPIVLRLLAKLGGVPTTAAVELRTQNFFFAFQVVQVFLVTTLSSAATSVVTSIIQNPQSAASLLAQNIPKASNFYIAYFILQGLTFSSGALLQIVGLIISKILGKLFDNTPRKMYTRWSTLAGMGWGTILPVVTNLCVIAITYAAIAPLVLGFATIGLYLFYVAYRYNMLYVNNTDIDTKGMIYPRALQQTTVGCYLLIVCLIGLFAIGAASDRHALGPLILMIICGVFTVLYHFALSQALYPLLNYLPKNLEVDETSVPQHAPHNGASGEMLTDAEKGLSNGAASEPPMPKANPLVKFFQPYKYANYATLRQLVPHDSAIVSYPPEVEQHAYFHPSIGSTPPLLWIPRDAGGISKQEVAHTSKVIPITDEDAFIDDNGKITWNEESGVPPIYQEKIYY
ncbi:phosphate metabolism protein 7 [Ophidiomyces ophidiicola]|uniref:Phosphate metabolism protein 7 n=1 Tax=Ophidiomyces ophidiicola TaxID=1387563 RepID=A0ACB8US85_9EURO|nr:phosphate metabolism protein 7 [Ophidiomyces ophidiicola]KAI1910331.1 phosphate metabolism protein 7 [Ophidiomyces ophidiicola]KAI1913750.1 phosphate metabolism protein 7 [Ophidiomyces ophidiicola]KAI1928625.1 phosphate metabolism protein 7 [Ophidiomyces ophidiicola]KAI1937839.1 phosphate metabolism protein 7 [Ophidiomyces ophidiicola]KAI1942373.1 phosphate metabolism protein 7 [Ophidiomyces ophidiicola]